MKSNRKQEVKEMLPVYLEYEHAINTRRLFCCLNPEHEDSTPSMGYYDKGSNGPKVHCFGCNATYDLFDIIQLDYPSSNPRDRFIRAYKIYNDYKQKGLI